jgi:DNA-directed RNA polymerase subunit RPC12/RpoP
MNEVRTEAIPTRSNLMADENAKCKRCGAKIIVHYREMFTASACCTACGSTFVYELGAGYTA